MQGTHEIRRERKRNGRKAAEESTNAEEKNTEG
jgi:hypothetical protein